MPVPAARDPLPACRQRAPRRLSRGQEAAQVGWFRSSRRKGLPPRREDVRVAGVTVLPDTMAELGLVQSAALAAGQWGAAEGGVLHLQRRCGGGAGRPRRRQKRALGGRSGEAGAVPRGWLQRGRQEAAWGSFRI